MHFGYDEHPPNHVHNIKPLVALPLYTMSIIPVRWIYKHGINLNVWRGPATEHQFASRRNIISQIRMPNSNVFASWIQPKDTILNLHSHIFDNDANITNLTMRYELVCFMKDGSTEYKLIDEFDIMPYKLIPGIVDAANTFLYDKIFFLSDLQPNHANMAMFNIRIKNVASTQTSLNNESVLNIILFNKVYQKAANDAIIANTGK